MCFRRLVAWTIIVVLCLGFGASVIGPHPTAAAPRLLPATTVTPPASGGDVAELRIERAAIIVGANCSLSASVPEAVDGESVSPGRYVVTDGLGRAQLGFEGAARVTVYHDSCVQVTGAQQLTLFEGTLATRTGQEALAIAVENVAIEASGRVLIHLSPERSLWVVVEEGRARVDVGGREVSLSAGQQTWVEPGGAPVAPQPNKRAAVGDRFFLIGYLTNGAIRDADLLTPPAAVSGGARMPWGLLIALAAVAGGGVLVAVLSRRRGTVARRGKIVPPSGEVVGLRQVRSTGYGDLIPLRGGGLTIGRAPNNNLVLNDNRISARHARLIAQPDGFYVEDLQSTNGTFVDSERVSRQRLHHGDVLQFDRMKFIFQHGPNSPVSREPAPPPRSPQSAPHAGVRLQEGGEPGRFIPLDRDGLTMGRDDANDAVLRDHQVSSHHARIVATEQGYFIEDLGSTNGTFVQGQRVTRQHLQGGEIIQLGQMELIFEVTA